jgi:spore maturation protein CgeB
VRVALFCHSLRSDWNHGNAHFLRGLTAELVQRGHPVDVWEPRGAWSVAQLVAEHGSGALERFRAVYPEVTPRVYEPGELDLEAALDGVDLVLVHEWNEPALVAALGAARAAGGRFRLLFHDTHHRSVTDRAAMAAYDLSGYDGVLAFGRVIKELYLRARWTRRAYTFHEAADARVFAPRDLDKTGDLVWIGNWGDDERSAELGELLLRPVRALGLRATVHGVRYPEEARRALAAAGIAYAGWLPNFEVPAAFARHRVTVHVPRRPYVRALPGIPTIRPFEALACGIPLVCSAWDDAEGLFTPGQDYLVARDGAEMTRALRLLLAEPARAAALAAHGRRTVLARHTCAHRAEQLLAIAAELEAPGAPAPTAPTEMP